MKSISILIIILCSIISNNNAITTTKNINKSINSSNKPKNNITNSEKTTKNTFNTYSKAELTALKTHFENKAKKNKNKDSETFMKHVQKSIKDYCVEYMSPTAGKLVNARDKDHHDIIKADMIFRGFEIPSVGISDLTYENFAFAEGRCNPVLIVPGLLASKLSTEIKCHELYNSTDENEKLVADSIDQFCGQSICKDKKDSKDDIDDEDHVLWASVINSPFQMYQTDWNKDSMCFGLFFNIFNRKDSCPVMKDNTTSCLSSKFIKVKPYGLTSKTKFENDCGAQAYNNLATTNNYSSWLTDAHINNNDSTKGFHTSKVLLESTGYRNGYSLAGVPYDFREPHCKNPDFTRAFNDLVDMLERNTGKKVVILSHSFGTINTYHQLLNNKNARSKVQKYIAAAPPLAGAAKILQLATKGSTEFKNNLIFGYNIDWHRRGQAFSNAHIFGAHGLRPFNVFDSYKKNDNNGKKFKAAILHRMKQEKECSRNYNNCTEDYLKTKLGKDKFAELFPEVRPIYTETCIKNAELLHNSKNSQYDYSMKEDDTNNTVPIKNVCSFNFYNYERCAVVRDITVSNNPNLRNKNKQSLKNALCNNDFNNYYAKEHDSKVNGKEQKGLKSLFHLGNDITNYPFNDTNFTNAKVKTFFENNFKKNIGESQDVSNDICTDLKDLKLPGVDTVIIANNSLETKGAIGMKRSKDKYDYSKDEFTRSDFVWTGGDGTVPSSSSTLTGLKWIYDNSLLPKEEQKDIKLVDYCDQVEFDNQHKYYLTNSQYKNKKFVSLRCRCNNKSKNDHKYEDAFLKKSTVDDCNHSAMLGDPYLIDFVFANLHPSHFHDYFGDYKTKKHRKDVMENIVIKIDPKNAKYDKRNIIECNKILSDSFGYYINNKEADVKS